MSRITNMMTLVEFPEDAVAFFEEVFSKIESDSTLMTELDELKAFYFEKFTCEELTARLTALSEKAGYHKFTIDMIFFLYCCETFQHSWNIRYHYRRRWKAYLRRFCSVLSFAGR